MGKRKAQVMTDLTNRCMQMARSMNTGKHIDYTIKLEDENAKLKVMVSKRDRELTCNRLNVKRLKLKIKQLEGRKKIPQARIGLTSLMSVFQSFLLLCY